MFLSSITSVYGQVEKIGAIIPWSTGTIVLKDNTILKGEIEYNQKLGLIAFRESNGDLGEPITERRVQKMDLYDATSGRWRNFATFSLNFGSHVKEDEREDLYEVVLEFSDFALLVRNKPVDAVIKVSDPSYSPPVTMPSPGPGGGVMTVGGSGAALPQTKMVGYEQLENFLLVDVNGMATKVLEVKSSAPPSDKGINFRSHRVKSSLNKRVLPQYLKNDWKTFDTIVKANRFDLKKKEDFLAAFEQLYSELDQ